MLKRSKGSLYNHDSGIPATNFKSGAEIEDKLA